MAIDSKHEAPATSASGDRLRRWGLVAAILGVAAIVIVWMIVRAIPDEAEARLQIGGWTAPVGVVVSTDDVGSHLPGIVVRSLLGDEPLIQLDGGRVQEATGDTLRIASITGDEDITYNLTEATRTVNVRNPLVGGAPTEGQTVAVLTSPDSRDALVILTGVTLSE